MTGEHTLQHEDSPPYSSLTWLGSDRGLARWVGQPMVRFAHIEAAGGVALLAATVIALIWANSPWDGSYHQLLETHLSIDLGGLLVIDEPLEVWVNDALMTVFFFVVGLEIKRELAVGELRKPAAVALPAMAALGGMVVPAAFYLAFNAGGDGSSGWGIPMATDIAFAVGVVSLLGSRVPSSLKLFLLTLAIVDDIGAIVVIAVFYTDDLSSGWLLAAAGTVVVLAIMRITRVWYTPAYLVPGLFLWLAVFESGVHATIAGVILGVFTPASPLMGDSNARDQLAEVMPPGSVTAPAVRRAYFEVREHVSVAERLQNLLHPWTSFIIIPIFALANAGVALSSDSLGSALQSPVTLGIVAGLVAGKLIGVSLFTWLGVRSGLCVLPQGATWAKMVGISAVAGIGFTVSLFIARLGFEPGTAVLSEAKIGVLAASAIAASLGAIILLSSGRGGAGSASGSAPGGDSSSRSSHEPSSA